MKKLTVAVQKKGRMSDKSLNLLKETGIEITNGERKLIAVSSNFPIRILYLRDDDIPQYVADGVADIGIVGENEVLEKEKDVEVVQKLGFAKCRLALAIPKNIEFSDMQWFQNKRIATSYPKILSTYFNSKNINTDIHTISGSVEIAPGIGLADAIFDIVSSGSTLLSNGLKEVATILTSEAVIIKNKDLDNDKQSILNDLLFRINAVKTAKDNRYILLNAPNNKLDEIIQLIPGMNSPTIVPLAQEGWSSVQSVVSKNRFWQVIDKLKDIGAQGILVLTLEKMVN